MAWDQTKERIDRNNKKAWADICICNHWPTVHTYSYIYMQDICLIIHKHKCSLRHIRIVLIIHKHICSLRALYVYAYEYICAIVQFAVTIGYSCRFNVDILCTQGRSFHALAVQIRIQTTMRINRTYLNHRGLATYTQYTSGGAVNCFIPDIEIIIQELCKPSKYSLILALHKINKSIHFVKGCKIGVDKWHILKKMIYVHKHWYGTWLQNVFRSLLHGMYRINAAPGSLWVLHNALVRFQDYASWSWALFGQFCVSQLAWGRGIFH